MGETDEQAGRHTSSKGASSGAESYPLALLLVLALTPAIELRGVAAVVAVLAVAQLLLAKPIDRAILWHGVTSQAFGPAMVRNASIGFAQCVRPGGRPTADHCLALFHYHPLVTSMIFAPAAILMFALGPLVALIRVFYPEHRQGVNGCRGNYLKLWWFFVRHPVAIQGEGPSNGDGLAAMGGDFILKMMIFTLQIMEFILRMMYFTGSESLIYPLTRRHLARGPLDQPYWLLRISYSSGRFFATFSPETGLF